MSNPDYHEPETNSTEEPKDRLRRLIEADLAINREQILNTEEEHFGTLSLEHVVVVTRWLGRIRGAQVLCLVDKPSIGACAQCGELVAAVQIGNLKFNAEIERPFGDQFIVNLVAEHVCADEEGGCDE